MKKYFSILKKSVPFYFLIVLFWLFWFLKAYFWSKYNDNIVNIITLILSILTILMIVFSSLIIKKSRNEKSNNNLFAIILLLFVGIFFHIWMLSSFNKLGINVLTTSNIISKFTVSEQYYFSIMDTDLGRPIIIKCNKENYENIEINENIYYSMEYRKLNFIKNKGYLGNIDTVDIIDNQ